MPVTRAIAPTQTPLRAALQELLLMPPTSSSNPALSNYWKGRNLRVQSVSLHRGLATIHISGDIYVAGICDQPRILSQIEATVRQFKSVKKVRVFLDNRPLAEAIS